MDLRLEGPAALLERKDLVDRGTKVLSILNCFYGAWGQVGNTMQAKRRRRPPEPSMLEMLMCKGDMALSSIGGQKQRLDSDSANAAHPTSAPKCPYKQAMQEAGT